MVSAAAKPSSYIFMVSMAAKPPHQSILYLFMAAKPPHQSIVMIAQNEHLIKEDLGLNPNHHIFNFCFFVSIL